MDRVDLNIVENFAIYGKENLKYELNKILDDETVLSLEIVKETKEVEKENEKLNIDYYMVGVFKDLT